MCLNPVSVLDFFWLRDPSSARCSLQFIFHPVVPHGLHGQRHHKPHCNPCRVGVFAIVKGDVPWDTFSQPRHNNTSHKDKKMI